MQRSLAVLLLLGLALVAWAQDETTEPAFSADNFKVRFGHEFIGSHPVVSQHIVQGTRVVLQLRIDAVDGTSTADWRVSVAATLNGADAFTNELQWAPQLHAYTAANLFDTAGVRGRLALKYTFQASDENSFTQSESYTIGYGLSIVEEAVRDRARLPRGSNIGLGTEFHFGLQLFNETHKDFVDGLVTLVVADASSQSIHHESKSAAEAEENRINFAFSLDAAKYANLVGGPLFFQFDVQDDKVSHSRDTLYFKYPVQMVASDIHIVGGGDEPVPQFEIGQEITVSMKPGSAPSFPHVQEHDQLANRQYFVDVHSETGGQVWSLKGDAQADGSLRFRWEVPKTLDSHGVALVSFRFVSSTGESIALQNFDSANNELFDDNAVAYRVHSKFELQQLQHPAVDDFYYGNTIAIKFRIRDTVAGSLLTNGRASKAFLFLSQSDGVTEFVSTKKEAESNADDEFEIDWLINVNAIPGAGKVAIVVAELEGAEKINFGHSFDVNIGGTIETNHKTFISSTAVSAETAFLAQFTLSCRDKVLINPQLRSVVSYSDGKSAFKEIFRLKVASNDAGDASVSWTAAHAKSPSGKYRLSFYRENAQADSEALFVIDLNHSLGRTTEPLIRFEWLLFFGSVFTFVALEFRRRKLLKA